MNYQYDIEYIKENLDIDQIFELLSDFHGEPIEKGSTIISKTICHHPVDELAEAGHKLYYYDNTHLFHCFSGGCAEPSFDVFELVRKVKTMEDNKQWELPQAVQFVAIKFGFSENAIEEEIETDIDEYLEEISKYDRINNIDNKTQIVELKEYDDTFLSYLPHNVDITPWIEDNITSAAMNRFEICYEPKNCSIIIPHRDINGKLIGVRQRTLIQEQAEKYGKYMPLKLGGKMYNHPLSFALYGLYQNKENIKKVKKAIVLESEKSVLQLDSILGKNNIGVACCGSNLIAYQTKLLIDLGVEEIIIGFDHDFNNVNEDNAKKKIRNLKTLQKKYGNFVKLSFIWDKNGLTGLKASPTDCGKDVFMQLFRERVNLY